MNNIPIDWQPIIKMNQQPHGFYLVLYRGAEEHYIIEQYFTYKDGKTVFNTPLAHEKAIAFMVPRVYTASSIDRFDKVLDKIDHISKNCKTSQSFRRLAKFIKTLHRRLDR